MKFRITPNTDEFFVLFGRTASNMRAAVAAFADMVDDFTDLEAKYERIKVLEHQGDELNRQMHRSLDTTFVTPFDREDIHALASGLDDVIDDVNHVAEFLKMIPFEGMLAEFKQQCHTLLAAADATVELIDRLSQMKGLRPLIERIDQLESEGDGIYRRALARLFSGEMDTLDVLKWKDLVQATEDAIDKLEDVADVVGSILVKHA